MGFSASSQGAGNLTDAYASKFERHVPVFRHHTFIVRETVGSNGLTYKIEAKLVSGGTYVEIQGDTAVAANGTDTIQIEGAYSFLKLSAKNTTGGQTASYAGEYAGQR